MTTEETTLVEEVKEPLSTEEVAEEKVERYTFDGAFQTKIAALVVRDTIFNQHVDGLIKPDYFESMAEAGVVNIALKYYAKYKKIPADMTIYSLLIKEDITTKVLKKEEAKLIVLKLKELQLYDISDRDYVIDQVATFARHQAVSKAILDSVTKLDKRDFEGISKIVRRALDVGANHDTGSYDYEEMIDIRTGERLSRAAGKLPPTGITTGFRAIDEILYHRGWGKRELSVILGGAKAGKTTMLMEFGASAIAAGYNVLYVTLEVAANIIGERLDANISQRAMMELHLHPHEVRSKVKEFMKKAGKFILHEFPTGSMTVSDLRRLVERYKSRGIKFDLVIVDYADLMAPERYTDSNIENSKSVYVNLRGYAMQEDLAILTATQTNRDGYKAAVAKAEHVSEDFNKIRIADLVISINRTEEERASNQARLFFAASRNQAGNFTIRIEQDLDRMKGISKILGME